MNSVSRLCILFFFGLFSSCQSIQPTPNNQTFVGDVTLIKNVTVIDAVNEIRKDFDVLIEGSIISKIEKNISRENGVTQIDGSGKYLIPGLWDAHVHLTFEPELMSSMFDLFLVNGITSLRDTGGKLHLVKPMKEQADSNINRYPRVKIAGPLLDGMPRVYDGSTPQIPDISQGLNSVEEVNTKIDALAGEGVDLLKAYEMLSPELYKAVLSRAKMHGLKVTGHIPLSMTVQQAASEGLASIEHMRNLEMSMAKNADDALLERRQLFIAKKDTSGYGLRSYMHRAYRHASVKIIDEEKKHDVLQSLRENNTWQIPTLALILSSQLNVFTDSNWHKTFQYIPEKMEKDWLKYANQVSSHPSDNTNEGYMNWAKNMIREFLDYKIGIMAGTDCPIFFLTPGFSLHRELETLVEQGRMTPKEALYSATVRPAQYFNLQDKLGTIEQGKLADLILLDKNPLQNIRHTTSINAVFKNGTLYDSKKLDIMKSQLDNGRQNQN